ADNSMECNPDTFIDNTPPRCNGVDGASNQWTNKDRTITQHCADDLSGCTQPYTVGKWKYDVNNLIEVRESQIEIFDNATNKTICPVSVYFDSKKPELLSEDWGNVCCRDKGNPLNAGFSIKFKDISGVTLKYNYNSCGNINIEKVPIPENGIPFGEEAEHIYSNYTDCTSAAQMRWYLTDGAGNTLVQDSKQITTNNCDNGIQCDVNKWWNENK
ncbi:MAG: hypothetical protein RSB54_02280, partial [Bacilli bacterium]